MFSARTRSLIPACALVAGLAIPATANATNYVSPSPVVAGGKSCAQPSFNSVQAALNAQGGSKVIVCPGTYTEQVTITKGAKLVGAGTAGSAKLQLPASPANSATACDKAVTEAGFQADQDEVSICTSEPVSITGITVEAKWPEGTCYDSLYGIRVAGGGLLTATNVTVAGAGAAPINGCQGGVGIQAGSSRTTPAQVGRLKLKGVTVSEYQKNGITIAGAGSSASITNATVIGAGATTQIAQNGIQVSGGAVATIKSSKVSGNECDNAACGPDGFSQTQSTGLLFFGAAPGSTVSSSTLSGNDIGTYYVSESSSQPTKPELALSKDVYTGNRYEGVSLDQGDAVLKGLRINGPGEVGIELLQYEGQTLSSQSSATSTKIEGMSEAGIRVASDNAAGDIPGKFSLSKTMFNGNATVLKNESSTFEVVF